MIRSITSKTRERLENLSAHARAWAMLHFWKRVRVEGTTKCWVWLGRKDDEGYGKFQLHDGLTKGSRGQIHFRAHRFLYWVISGELPEVVMHDCDHPWCVNPVHLRGGTQALNRADCAVKGRTAIGDRHGRKTMPERFVAFSDRDTHPRAKVTKQQVEEIRRRHRRGLTKVLADEFGVHPGTIWKFVR